MVKVTVVVPFNAMLAAANVFKMTGGVGGGGVTVSCAVPGAPGVTPVQTNVEVVLIHGRGLANIPFTVTWGSVHVPPAGIVPPVRVMDGAVTVNVPPQAVTAAAGVACKHAGSVSVKAQPVRSTVFGLLRTSCKVVDPFSGIDDVPNVFWVPGGREDFKTMSSA